LPTDTMGNHSDAWRQECLIDQLVYWWRSNTLSCGDLDLLFLSNYYSHFQSDSYLQISVTRNNDPFHLLPKKLPAIFNKVDKQLHFIADFPELRVCASKNAKATNQKHII
jgi:hypothetical protein